MLTFQYMIISGAFKIYRQKTTFWLTIVTNSVFRWGFKKYLLIIQTNDSLFSQSRKYTKNYKNKITKLQLKYIVLF